MKYISVSLSVQQAHSVLHTQLSNPSVSLIKSICYPQKVKLLSDTCAYGCKHEDEARSIYSEVMKSNHSSFTLKPSGLLLDPSSPFVGASPDGIVECSCCGCGVLEIKCPYSCEYQSFEDRTDENSGATVNEKNMQEELVGCDNLNCKIQRYHLSCLQLTLSHSYQRANGIVQNVTKSDTSQSARERARQVRRNVRVFKH